MPHKQNCWFGRVIKWKSFIIWERSFIPMKLIWHDYLIYNLGNSVMKLCIETGLIYIKNIRVSRQPYHLMLVPWKQPFTTQFLYVSLQLQALKFDQRFIFSSPQKINSISSIKKSALWVLCTRACLVGRPWNNSRFRSTQDRDWCLWASCKPGTNQIRYHKSSIMWQYHFH